MKLKVVTVVDREMTFLSVYCLNKMYSQLISVKILKSLDGKMMYHVWSLN